jgi:hypothetical protein
VGVFRVQWPAAQWALGEHAEADAAVGGGRLLRPMCQMCLMCLMCLMNGVGCLMGGHVSRMTERDPCERDLAAYS